MTESRSLIALAIPLALQQLGFQLMGTVDAAWLGRYSDTALAAAGVGNNLLFAVTSIGMGIVMGLDTVIPQAVGAGRHADARRALHGGFRLAILVGLAATAVVIATPVILDLASVDADVAAEARPYIYMRAVGIVPFLLSIALRSYLAARDVTRPLVLAVVLGNIANYFLDGALIFGVPSLGIPALGVIGAAIATITVQLGIVLVYVAAVRSLDGAGRTAERSTRADLVGIMRYGAPVGGQMFAEVGIFGVATVIAAHMGKVPGAAHTVALTLCSFTFSVAVGIGSATSVRVGHAVGAKDLALARRRGFLGLGVGLAVMGAFGVVLVALPSQIAGLLTSSEAIVEVAAPLLVIAAIFQLSDGTQAIGAGALRGLGDTRATLVGNIIGHYGIGLGISLALGFGADMGPAGLWWGLSAGLTATAAYLVARFVAGTRRTL